ncbi:hypothetical protein HL669_23355 [Vibrio parahaemolyticus]|uniref:hypothetical protein n=2 Tax=Vibrio parahaemolyticus TaxID=670 RepID=UPI0011238DDB|nr:hypothetical protein [Vibrio parahaemolyticus]MDG2642633.1 hypothetical protein [Vibrio parahaemolyticus]NNU14543.1 hypothetical protein [Vibrio parahaemolyticus]TOJ64843.1 hypothetical protein CGI34_18220 [Vibrio parahaemolyticus]
MKAFFIMGITYCIFCASAWANDYAEETGKISYFQVHKNPTDVSNSGQRFIVRLDSEISSNKCGNSDSWTGTLDTDAGKAIYSAILSAAMADRPIMLQGTGENVCLDGNMLIRNVLLVW